MQNSVHLSGKRRLLSPDMSAEQSRERSEAERAVCIRPKTFSSIQLRGSSTQGFRVFRVFRG
jgi:hypothetical protein